jgi:uncharacterized membrane protein YgcG
VPGLIVLMALLLALPAWGQEEGPDGPAPTQSRQGPHGPAPTQSRQRYPAPRGRVTDVAQALDAATQEKLRALLADLERRTTVEMAVVVVSSTAPLTPKQYVTELFNRWGVGKRGADSGVMLLLAVQDRRVEVETGYGVEGILPDGRVGKIIRSTMLPHFRQNRWGEGLLAGVQELARILRAEYQPPAVPTAPSRPAASGPSLVSGLGWAYFLGWLGFLLWHNLRRHTLSYTVLTLSALPGLLWLFWGLMPFILPFILGVILAGANVRARCPRCGQWLTRQERTLQEPSYAAPGQREVIYDCPACGYHDVDMVILPSPTRVRTPSWPIGGASWPGGWSGGGGPLAPGPSEGDSSNRFGGGSSGGGGAGASF